MNQPLRARDPGLQPERTVMSWHRTVFSALVLSILISRASFSHGDLLIGAPGIIAILFSLMVMVVSIRRQKFIRYDTTPVSVSSVTIKKQMCAVLFLNAVALMTHSIAAVFLES